MSSASRWWIAAALTAALALMTPAAIAGVWFATVMLDTERYVDTVAPLIDDPDVQQALVDQVTGEIVDAVDVDEVLAEAPIIGLIPGAAEGLTTLIDPLLERVERALVDGVSAAVASDGVATAWESANRSGHAAVVGALTGTSDVVMVAGDEVSISADVVVTAVRDGLAAEGLDTLASLVPDVEAQIVLLRTDALPLLQAGLRVLDVVGSWLWIVGLAVTVVVVVLCPWRWAGLAMAAGGVLAGTVLLAAATTLLRGTYVGTQTDVLSPAARQVVIDQVTAGLRTTTNGVAWTALVVLVIGAAGWWVTGGQAAIRRARADQSP